MSQKEIVYNIVYNHQPIRTEQVEAIAMKEFISGGSAGRYLRYLQEAGKIIGYKVKGRQTKVWQLINKQTKLFREG